VIITSPFSNVIFGLPVALFSVLSKVRLLEIRVIETFIYYIGNTLDYIESNG